MANEHYSADLASLNAGQLLSQLAPTVNTLSPIDSDLAVGGGIPTRDNAAQPETLDDRGRFSSMDRVSDIDMAASIREGETIAKKGRSEEQPRQYHLVVEHADRYYQATGLNTLFDLSRVVLGTLGIAAEREGSSLRTIVARDNERTRTINRENFNKTAALAEFEEIADAYEHKRPTGLALSDALEELAHMDENFSAETDVVVVASDFLGGEQLDDKKNLVGFDWAQPLEWLNAQLDDRLLVVQLVTPAQTNWPNARVVEVNGKNSTYDTREQLTVAERYNALATRKAQLISKTLQHMRHLELSSTDRTPLLTVPDFMFAQPTRG